MKGWRWKLLGVWLVLVAVDCFAFALRLAVGKAPTGVMFSLYFPAFWFFLTPMRQTFAMRGFADMVESSGMSERARILAERLGVSSRPVYVLTGGPGEWKLASVLEDRICITEKLAKEVSIEALDWILGHELAHLRVPAKKKAPLPPVVTVALMVLIYVALMSIFVVPFGLKSFVGFGLVFASVLLFSKLGPSKTTPEIELECDRLAASVTSPEAGLEALSALLEAHRGEKGVEGYPSRQRRLAQMTDMLEARSVS